MNLTGCWVAELELALASASESELALASESVPALGWVWEPECSLAQAYRCSESGLANSSRMPARRFHYCSLALRSLKRPA